MPSVERGLTISLLCMGPTGKGAICLQFSPRFNLWCVEIWVLYRLRGAKRGVHPAMGVSPIVPICPFCPRLSFLVLFKALSRDKSGQARTSLHKTGQSEQLGNTLRGPAALRFVPREDRNDSIAKFFRVGFMRYHISIARSHLLQIGGSHRYAASACEMKVPSKTGDHAMSYFVGALSLLRRCRTIWRI